MSAPNIKDQPKDGWQGLLAHWSSDLASGFTVFLLALPLSLGIAKASEFPPLMGLVTAIIGGIVVSLFMGSRLSIKGPAAGLIVIVAGAVTEMGGGVVGWHMALAAIVVAGVIQVLFGLLRLGKMTDFFPLPAIHGMLAAIGLIIIAKQIPVLLDINPAFTKGKSPFQLFGDIPYMIVHLDYKATIIGVMSLCIMMGWPYLKSTVIKKIPAPLMVLAIAIPAELLMDFQHTEPPYALVHIGNLAENLKWNLVLDGPIPVGLFIKYVIMFALVGTLESLLTVKAVDILDPYKRKSNTNKDLIAVGAGNILAAFLGGLPMISEVARSSANVSSGAKTRWSNFFHGMFILIFVLLATPLIELIPNTALAAMLITVGIKLAHPKEFIQTFRIGKEQLAIFVVTIFFTLFEDLLIGIFAGIVLNFIIQLYHGAPLSSFFKSKAEVAFDGDEYQVTVHQAALFSNFIGLKQTLDSIPAGFNVTIDFDNTCLVDHSVMENMEHFKHDYEARGGKVIITGLNDHVPLAGHELSTRKKARV